MTLESVLDNDWPMLSALLDDALALPASQREPWLAELQGDDAVHRDTLRALLATQAEVETGDFLAELPAVPGADTAPPHHSPAAGHLVGAYRLIEPIGHGGMGTVWLAERADGVMKRRVALKLPHAVWGDAFTERLVREREILAALDHPHIARLYDAGVDAQDRPFLAMAFVAGQPIDAHCRERALSLQERVELLLQVMAAVAHAHARLVVHRDLKPNNILVGGDGQAVLLDFGIAKLLDGERTRETALTALSGRALTLDYASPEQIRGEPLGTASDIYSLAVVAYELLAGARPYRLKRGSAAELEEAIAATDAPLASDMATDPLTKRELRGDLDAILNKALKKQLSDRYPTMDAFADDLRRWRDGEPVQARPDTAGYRAAKFIRRHRAQVAAGSVVVVALMVGTTLALWQAHEARTQAERAQTEAQTAKAVQGFLQNVFRANSSNQADPIKARDTTARTLLDRGAERIETELASAPAARLALYTTLAGMYAEMGLDEQLVAMERRRLALARELFGEAGTETVLAMSSLSDALTNLDKRQEALDLLNRASNALDSVRDVDSPTRLQVEIGRANLYLRIDLPKALPPAQRAVVLARRNPPSAELVNALQLLGEIESRLEHGSAARAALEEAAGLVERQPELGLAALPMIYGTLAYLHGKAGEFGESEASYAKAIEVARDRVGAVQFVHISTFKLANTQYANGRFAESLATIAPTVAWVREKRGATGLGQTSATMIGALGRIQTAYGRPEEGLATLDEALALIARDEQAPDHLGPLLSMRSDALVELGRYSEAEATLRRAMALIGDNQTGQAHFALSARRHLWMATGRAEAALADHVAQGTPKGDDTNPAAKLQRHAERAAFALGAGHDDLARTEAEAAIAGIEGSALRQYLREPEATASLALGQALLKQGHAQAALAPLQRADALRRAMFDPERSLALADVLIALGQARRLEHDELGANAALAEARAIHTRHPSMGKQRVLDLLAATTGKAS